MICFRLMVISVPDDLSIFKVVESQLPKGWKGEFCEECLQIGSNWYIKNEIPILQVPSTIIPDE